MAAFGHDRTRTLMVLLVLAPMVAAAPSASAQEAPPRPHDMAPGLPRNDAPEPGRSMLHLSAAFPADPAPVRSGLQWRVFAEATTADGSRKLLAQSADPSPTFNLPEGRYIVHATFGYATAMKRVELAGGGAADEKLNLNAGAIEVTGLLGGAAVPAEKLSLAIFIPEHNNPEAKLVVDDAKPGRLIRLPEGNYHVVSTYLDTVGVGSLTPVSKTNSVVSADFRVQPGKLVQATMRHRAATLTLKLVNAPGGEALANSNFTILTPGGDVIREMIGAFPSLVLAEGDYVAIARHEGKTYQAEFKVEAALDRDVEVLAK